MNDNLMKNNKIYDAPNKKTDNAVFFFFSGILSLVNSAYFWLGVLILTLLGTFTNLTYPLLLPVIFAIVPAAFFMLALLVFNIMGVVFAKNQFSILNDKRNKRSLVITSVGLAVTVAHIIGMILFLVIMNI